MNKEIRILGIETSCDETAVAVVTASKKILSNQVYSQVKEHENFKGVVPEIAARNHMLKIESLIQSAMQESNMGLNDIDAIAVTSGPGLIGGLIVGIVYAKSLSFALNKPLIAINHLEAHSLTVRLTNDLDFPYLTLLVSGGHSQLVLAEKLGDYKVLGSTLDDALGEAFDKVAKMLNLDYPGGPEVEKFALKGANTVSLPVPLKGKKNCNFSFSGLKTAVRNYIASKECFTNQDLCDLCCSFQHAVLNIIQDRLKQAFKIVEEEHPNILLKNLVVAGGVASNKFLREKIGSFVSSRGYNLIVPPAALCTDNGAMVAWLGVEKFHQKKFNDLNFAPKTRWSLEDL